ncbi:MAG: protein kinase [Haloarculaceae archaeon]
MPSAIHPAALRLLVEILGPPLQVSTEYPEYRGYHPEVVAAAAVGVAVVGLVVGFGIGLYRGRSASPAESPEKPSPAESPEEPSPGPDDESIPDAPGPDVAGGEGADVPGGHAATANADGNATGGPPAEVPRGPDVPVEYGAVTKGDRIGKGGDADVFEATMDADGGTVRFALKEPRFSGTLHSDVVERFANEAETWSRLDDHDNVVDVVDYGAEPIPWIALEYMDGGDLAVRVGDLDVRQATWTALSIVRGVRHAHRHGVTHLDLKPGNVLFREIGPDEWDVPKVGDWGLAKMLLDHSKSMEGLTPQYAAPEQFHPDEYGDPDERTDIYQLGAVVYELYTGRPVFEGQPAAVMHQVTNEAVTPPTEVDPSLPADLDDVLLRALAKSKADRYDGILYLRDAFQDLYESL